MASSKLKKYNKSEFKVEIGKIARVECKCDKKANTLSYDIFIAIKNGVDGYYYFMDTPVYSGHMESSNDPIEEFNTMVNQARIDLSGVLNISFFNLSFGSIVVNWNYSSSINTISINIFDLSNRERVFDTIVLSSYLTHIDGNLYFVRYISNDSYKFIKSVEGFKDPKDMKILLGTNGYY